MTDSEKNCIWCNRQSPKVTFDNEAHTFPKSIGGKFICEEVCDDCNWRFGSFGSPSVETVVKEAFIIIQYKICLITNQVGKNKIVTHLKSTFFELNKKKNEIILKPSFKLKPYFINDITRKFKRGIYKIFLEELHRQLGVGHDEKFDFIRPFARFDLEPELPLYILEYKLPIHIIPSEKMYNLEIDFNEVRLNKIEKYGFAEFDIYGYQISIPVVSNYKYLEESYLNHVRNDLASLYGRIIKMDSLLQLDLMLERIKDNNFNK